MTTNLITIGGVDPVFPKSAFVAPTATLIGRVTLGEESSIWFGAVLRADLNEIRIGNRTNLQDLVACHHTKDLPLIVEDEVTVGHGAILHACHIKRACLIGMGAIIMDGAVIGEESVVGAGALVPPGMVVPPRSLVVGTPGKVKRPLTAEEIAWNYTSAQNYVNYVKKYRA